MSDLNRWPSDIPKGPHNPLAAIVAVHVMSEKGIRTQEQTPGHVCFKSFAEIFGGLL